MLAASEVFLCLLLLKGFICFFYLLFSIPLLCAFLAHPCARASLREPQNTPKAAVKLPLMIYWFFLSSSLFTAYFLNGSLPP